MTYNNITVYSSTIVIACFLFVIFLEEPGLMTDEK